MRYLGRESVEPLLQRGRRTTSTRERRLEGQQDGEGGKAKQLKQVEEKLPQKRPLGERLPLPLDDSLHDRRPEDFRRA
eukprot:scaffold459067_cov32-Prasinocladus_malaysianus.AAC.1